VLNFQAPPGVTMASWDAGNGVVTDAFKPDQVPGASQPINGAVASAASSTTGDNPAPSDASQSASGGVDAGLGGIY